MIGLGTVINTGAILLGGVAGSLFGRLLQPRHRDTLNMACGVSVLFIGVAGAMRGMLHIEGSALTSGQGMLIVVCLVLGGIVGEILNLEHLLERFGEYLKAKTGNAKDTGFVDGFLTASLTVSVGAMAVVGALQDGLMGDWSILATKAILDLIIITVMTSSLGKGCMFSAIPVFLFEGTLTVLATLIKPILTDLAMDYLSLIGSILIFCVGMNLIFGKKVRVANLLPAILFGVAAALLPIQF